MDNKSIAVRYCSFKFFFFFVKVKRHFSPGRIALPQPEKQLDPAFRNGLESEGDARFASAISGYPQLTLRPALSLV
jgi:hypothetical protein